MIRRYTHWYPIGLLLLLAALTGWLERTVELAASGTQKRELTGPDFRVENFSAMQSGPDGLPRYALAASKMLHYPDDDSSHLANPNFTRMQAGQPPLYARADRGVVSSDGEHVYLMDNVRVVRANPGPRGPMTLATSSLHIQPEKDLAETSAKVTITDANTTVTAVGLELNAQTRVLKLQSEVKGSYVPPRK
ncbi:MAG TPA: LPS export ABC transporter periplasmic protein LptC [Burkholderiales bacterium]|nr:LPS export ABC transporter periplasmic protein LptC [Burkholderiales bacterium]